MFMKVKNTKNMNTLSSSLLKIIKSNKSKTQRYFADELNISVGKVNSLIKELKEHGYIDDKLELTDKAKELFSINKPKNAIILAAGFGMRMVPINVETPKGLIKVFGEPLIERIIKQLYEVSINDITIVVGFMKEQYEYLIDLYNVKLIVNSDYHTKNNLHSLNSAINQIDCTYIIPCDIWAKYNPFDTNEINSWYLVTDEKSKKSNIRVNNKNEFVIDNTEDGNLLIGISYINNADSKILKERIDLLSKNSKYDSSFWEEALISGNKLLVDPKLINKNDIFEINTYEQLRELDQNSNQLKNDAFDIICNALSAKTNDIQEIKTLKKGMTNRSFLFSCHNERYIMRIPGEGTDQLINRKEEAQVYHQIKDKNICDDIIYINENNGYKITKYFDNARVCNPHNNSDLTRCMSLLRTFHSLNLTVDHEFDLFERIQYYQSLWTTNKSLYRDYETTKDNVFQLKSFIDSQVTCKTLTHIDAVPDNFLFVNNDSDVRLIDWEYAAMQDPHVDIAMFCIYALYNRDQVDNLIDIYFKNNCKIKTRIKIYAYISICGLLWSNWCEYKSQLGIEFGEYSLKQYRYAKEYYKIVKTELLNIGEIIE